MCAGDRLQSGSGVFLNWSRALKNLSLSRVPLGPKFARIRRLVAFTATSARPLDWGKYADDTLCLTPHLSRNSLVAPAVYSGPPSLDNSSGTPNVEKSERKHAIRPRDPDQVLPEGVEKTSEQPDRRSPATTNSKKSEKICSNGVEGGVGGCDSALRLHS